MHMLELIDAFLLGFLTSMLMFKLIVHRHLVNSKRQLQLGKDLMEEGNRARIELNEVRDLLKSELDRVTHMGR
jgi:hypothetical protein